MKICSKCKIEKDLSEFSKCERYKDNYFSICKKCDNKRGKKYYENNKGKVNKRNNKNYQNNKEYIKEKNNKNYYNNKEQINKRHKKYNNSKANYNIYASQISWAKDPVRNIDGFLQTKCTYCGKWYFPSNSSVQSRIKALNGKVEGECRLYCSNECKEECSIYNQVKYPKGHKQSYSREVQPELRQMVFERDNYTCIKCGKHQDDVPLHCHHIEGIQYNPIESADIDICITVCKTCHSEIHQEDGCGYEDMKCKKAA